MDLKHRKIPRPIYFRYILLNIPEFAAMILILVVIQYWVVIPVWLLWSIIGFWIVKDAILFPFIWRAYDWDRAGKSRSMIGERGVAKEKLIPAGYVKIRGELWRAEKIGAGPPIEEGQPVRVKKMEGLTLFVVPEHTEDIEQKAADRS
jgi:membrane protein implicated in regulation of membrane protease activity